ncbi:helix-turn-helix transcriptional regulator [Paenibacillus koleovorans]|uniref:helix-turn-helix transcriptional regulator n=1 Tax=Paenibacillus koleovorans TaxID=121608 RepID=UPI0013E29BD4|nr:helix-turn-helix transcriptional regulator [Paenibacillus koleovorans]
MESQRKLGLYTADELLQEDSFLYVCEVKESIWLLEHVHDFVEIVCVLSGEGSQYIDGRPMTVRKDEVYLLPLGVSHVFRPSPVKSSTPLVVRNVIVRADWLERLAPLLPDPEMRLFVDWLLGLGIAEDGASVIRWRKVLDRSTHIRRLTERMQDWTIRRESAYRTKAMAAVLELLALLYQATYEADADEVAGTGDSSLDALMVHLTQSPPSELVLTDVAARFGLSERQILRHCHRHLGMSFLRFVQKHKIAQSCELLLSTDLRVQEVLVRSGFQSADHFNRLFKRQTGLTPSAYRKAMARV